MHNSENFSPSQLIIDSSSSCVYNKERLLTALHHNNNDTGSTSTSTATATATANLV